MQIKHLTAKRTKNVDKKQTSRRDTLRYGKNISPLKIIHTSFFKGEKNGRRRLKHNNFSFRYFINCFSL